MFWIFAAVIVALAVLHPGFRRFLGWSGVAIALIGVVWFALYQASESERKAEAERERQASDARYYLEQDHLRAQLGEIVPGAAKLPMPPAKSPGLSVVAVIPSVRRIHRDCFAGHASYTDTMACMRAASSDEYGSYGFDKPL